MFIVKLSMSSSKKKYTDWDEIITTPLTRSHGVFFNFVILSQAERFFKVSVYYTLSVYEKEW